MRCRSKAMRAAAAALVTALGAVACTSPEATRARGESRGADVGNRSDQVEMHGGSDPYWRTPRAAPAVVAPSAPQRPTPRVSRN